MEQLWAPALFRLLGFELVLLWLVALPVLLISRQGAVAWRLTAGAFSILGAAITFALREQVAWELGTIVANAFLLSGVGFAYACLVRLHQLPRSIRWEVWLPAAGFLAFVVLWLVDSTPGRQGLANVRVVVIALPMAGAPISWLLRLHQTRPRRLSVGTWYLMLGAGVAATASLVRAVVFAHSPPADPLQSPMAAVAVVIGMGTAMLMTCGLVLEAQARAQDQLRSSNAQLELAANTDPLTGIGNRRFFEAAAVSALAAGRGRGAPACVLVLDVDEFKRVNDQHGHPVGDVVLSTIAARIAAELREGDLVARWGGEEFAVILTGADRWEGARAAERLLDRLRHLPIEGCPELKVTVSAGLAAVGPEETLGGAQRRADEALYRAKEQGRDRVEVG